MRLFVDSCAWISLFDKADKYHEAASQNLRQIRDRAQLVTSDYVLDEVLTFLLYRTNKDIAVQCGRWALNADFLDILRVDEAVWQSAWRLF